MAVHEEGPLGIFADLRTSTGIEYGPEGRVLSYPDWNPLHCVFCTSLYAAAFTLVLPRWLRTVLAFSALAVLIERAQQGESNGE